MATSSEETSGVLPISFEHDLAKPPIGRFELAMGINEQAKFVFEHVNEFSFEPAWREAEDGTVELLYISAVRRTGEDKPGSNIN